MRLADFVFTALLSAVSTAGMAQPILEHKDFEVVGTAIRITDADGRVLTEGEMLGVEIALGDSEANQLVLRIDGIEHDSRDPELVFYNFSARQSGSAQWRPVCQPDYDGKTLGFLLQAVATPSGEYQPSAGAFSLQCTSGAGGKCVRFGYKPWIVGPDGASLWDHFRACTRMVRADYCGDGFAHTKNGTAINMYDPLGIQVSETSPEFNFEAAWGPAGALCVRKVRWPDIFSLKALETSCPRLRGRLGGLCSEESASRFGPVLLLNESKSPFLD